MKLILIFLLSTFTWANKSSDLNRLENVCNSQSSSRASADQNAGYCVCVKRKMSDEFSQPGDGLYLKMIADHVSGIDVDQQLRTTEGAYVFMDLYLNILESCKSK